MALTMLGFEGNFLVSSQLYFHGYEHDPYRLQNQASSLITGITEIMGMEGDNVLLQDIFSFVPAEERNHAGKLSGEFVNHGLFIRSSVRKRATIFNMSQELNQIFDGANK